MTRYVLGHSDRELDRLTVQARRIEPITRWFFTEAGLESGMRVLDVGSGAGDVAFLAAELVGAEGEVVGVDRSADALAMASERAAQRSLPNVSFHEGDPAAMTFDAPFDAVVGRYVLMFQPDPADMLRGLIRHLKPGGLVVFHEPEWARACSSPPLPSWDRAIRLLVETMTGNGGDMQMGMKLHSLYEEVGLESPTLRMTTVIGAGPNSSDEVHFTADLLVTVLADTERMGLVASGEIDPETFADGLLADVAASGSVVIGRSEIAAWSRV